MKILFLTQKIDEQDDDLAFTALWVREMIRQGVEMEVICLEKGSFDDSFPVFSLEKEKGSGKLRRVWLFFTYIWTRKYDTVYVHMNPEYITLGGWWWKLTGRSIYLWYTHYTMHIHMRIAGLLCTKMFAATKQSMPQFDGNPKKVVLGHGIDIAFWNKGDQCLNESEKKPTKLLTVHRICRSKRLDLVIEALALLPNEYTLDMYGRDVDVLYRKELDELVVARGLGDRVTFHGPVPMPELRAVYPQHALMVNMASETIDKTMVEAMLFGIFPVTTPGNSKAIGLSVYPEGESAKDIADFVLGSTWKTYDAAELQTIVKERHSLTKLITDMLSEMKYEPK